MFPELPQDLAALTDEELSALGDEFLETSRKVKARDEETLGDLSAEAIIEQFTAGVVALEAIKAEQTARAEADENFETTVDELAAKAGVSDPEPDPEPKEEDEAEATELSAEKEPEAEPVVAAAAKPTRLRRSAKHKPTPAMANDDGFLSQLNVPEVGVGYLEQVNRRKIGELLSHAIRRGLYRHGNGLVTVAKASYAYPEERQLDNVGAASTNERNVDKVTEVIHALQHPRPNMPESLVASGALCAPLTPIYDLPGVETAARPVRDALPSFQANRGGVIVGATPTMGDYAGAISHVTAADNEAGGTFAVKDCLRIICPDFTEVQVDAVAACIEADNLAARAYPELMARIDELVRAEQARVADSFLLTQIRDGSIDVSAAAQGGAVVNVFNYLLQQAAGIRNRHRIARGTSLRVLMPAWIIDLLQSDVFHQAYDAFPRSQAAIEGLFAEANVNASFYLDSPTKGNTQYFAAQTTGAGKKFPTTMQTFLFPEGTWLHLDSGTLDLGIVRDSSLNSTNDFQIFAEGWENVAFVGVESQSILIPVCPNGEQQAPQDLAITC